MSISSVSNSVVVNPQPNTQTAPAASEGLSFFGEIFDAINPLQHIPIVSNIYRALTGDAISPAANIAGGAIFGGPIGAGMAAVSEVAKAALGEAAKPEEAAFASNAADINKANEVYSSRMRITTSDWLNADFGRSITV